MLYIIIHNNTTYVQYYAILLVMYNVAYYMVVRSCLTRTKGTPQVYLFICRRYMSKSLPARLSRLSKNTTRDSTPSQQGETGKQQ